MKAHRLSRMSSALRPLLATLPALALLSACSSTPKAEEEAQAQASADTKVAQRSLASFSKPASEQACYDRAKEPYTALVDAHFHPRPFGGAAMPAPELFAMFDSLGVRFVNYFGIGQVLDLKSGCTYYLDCKGTPASPSVKNDFVNGMDVVAYPHENLHITLSMTFMDLAHPDDIVKTIEMYDKEYPGMFSWAGELNVMKQALLGNKHEPATFESIDAWAPFMAILKERNIPVTLHSDLGNNANPTEFLPLMEYVLAKYPDNKIVWAHMGLSKELTKIPPNMHVSIMQDLLDKYPNLMLDISWDVLYNAYHQWGPIFIDFFNAYPTRILPGSDFVAADSKARDQYAKELEVTSRALKYMDDNAFRHIALGENFFRLMNLDYHAPEVCKAPGK
jgi:predicted TIM-barrel fold metal-dependent hydrolase